MPNPQETVMELLFGRWRSQILHAGVRLGVFDAIGDGQRATADIASTTSVDPSLGYRLFRALGSLGLLQESSDRKFSLTEAGQLLRSDHPQTMRGVTLLEEGPEHYALWKHLPDMVRDGRQDAFVREFGHPAFEHTAVDHNYASVFNDAMSSYSSAQTAWALDALSGFDFGGISSICDVGGGQGHLLCSFLSAYPHLQGTVLDLPEVVEDQTNLWSDRLGVGDRCRYVGGNMFDSVPSADAYFMKMILHDWNDEECAQILAKQAQAAQRGGRVFIIEHLVSDPGTPHFAKLFDIHMMCWGTGRERTADEYTTLLEAGGWRHDETRYPTEGLMGVVVGVKP